MPYLNGHVKKLMFIHAIEAGKAVTGLLGSEALAQETGYLKK